MNRFLGAVLLLLFATATHAQGAAPRDSVKRMLVGGTDSLGAAIADEVRDSLRARSAGSSLRVHSKRDIETTLMQGAYPGGSSVFFMSAEDWREMGKLLRADVIVVVGGSERRGSVEATTMIFTTARRPLPPATRVRAARADVVRVLLRRVSGDTLVRRVAGSSLDARAH